MNKVKKNLVMQDLIVHCHLAKGATTALYKVKKIKWRMFTSFEEVTKNSTGKTMEERNDS